MRGRVMLIVIAGGACSPYAESARDTVDASGAASVDASVDAGTDAAAASTCVDGRMRGVLFDATTGANGRVCKLENAANADGAVAGLEATDYDGFTEIDGEGAYGCIGVEFDRPIETVFMRVGAVPNACGRACEGGDCGSGRSMIVLSSATRADYAVVALPEVGPELADQSVSVPSGTRVVLLCRRAWSADKDDIAVDSVAGDCR